MKKLIILILLSLFLSPTVSADLSKAGSCGAQFLKIGIGSRYQAMGEASVAVANDIYATYWNPAGLAEIENAAVSFTNVNYLLDISLNYVGFARRFEDVGVFGLSATILTTGDQEITTLEYQEGTGEYYSSTSYTFGMTFARQLNAQFSFGASIKYIGERIHNESAHGFGVDFGTLLYPGLSSLRLGVSISNMGAEMSFSGSDLIVSYYDDAGDDAINPVSAALQTNSYDLPMLFRMGAAYDVELTPMAIVTIAGEIKHPNDNVQQGSVGAEFGFNEMFFLRGGYKINYDEEGLTVGGGLDTRVSKSTRLLIDYAWQDFGRLESTQRFSVGFTF
ncbi:MAG: PorV/PorQ family protein [Candidatus Zixiibacteriota bacterium]|nr:MAG: PorV/PorQ family protein [candidate division Zixibacteria bacterium]